MGRDPIGYRRGIHPYDYAWSNPGCWVDPIGLTADNGQWDFPNPGTPPITITYDLDANKVKCCTKYGLIQIDDAKKRIRAWIPKGIGVGIDRSEARSPTSPVFGIGTPSDPDWEGPNGKFGICNNPKVPNSKAMMRDFDGLLPTDDINYKVFALCLEGTQGAEGRMLDTLTWSWDAKSRLGTSPAAAGDTLGELEGPRGNWNDWVEKQKPGIERNAKIAEKYATTHPQEKVQVPAVPFQIPAITHFKP